jgi:hypothetical protein
LAQSSFGNSKSPQLSDTKSLAPLISVPRSPGSLVAAFIPGVTPSIPGSRSETPDTSGSSRLTTHQLEMARILKIDLDLVVKSDNSLQMSWKRYKAINAALLKRTKVKWPGKTPQTTEVAEILISKSTWYKPVQPNFKKVGRYPQMVDWLERDADDDDPSDLEVWGVEKSRYLHSDLTLWLNNSGTLVSNDVTPSPPSRKSAAKPSQKGKQRMKDVDESKNKDKGGGSGSNKKSHKKGSSIQK